MNPPFSNDADVCLLIHMIRHGNIDLIKYFLSTNNVNVNGNMIYEINPQNGDCEEETPLSAAIEENRADIVKLLLEYGADVNAKDSIYGTTLLDLVLNRETDINIIKLLLEYGADINVKSYKGMTILHLAVRRHRTKAVSFLLSYCK